jgi:hypothetical protein
MMSEWTYFISECCCRTCKSVVGELCSLMGLRYRRSSRGGGFVHGSGVSRGFLTTQLATEDGDFAMEVGSEQVESKVKLGR